MEGYALMKNPLDTENKIGKYYDFTADEMDGRCIVLCTDVMIEHWDGNDTKVAEYKYIEAPTHSILMGDNFYFTTEYSTLGKEFPEDKTRNSRLYRAMHN